MSDHERAGDALIFRAGAGDWFNQPGNYRWDMGEDVEVRPPSQWHLDLRDAVNGQPSVPRIVVVDVSGMTWLVGVDFGFLIGLSKRLSASNTLVALVGNEHVRNAARLLKLSQFFDVRSSVDEALGVRGPNVVRPGTESRSGK